jgi:hypothetical protein
MRRLPSPIPPRSANVACRAISSHTAATMPSRACATGKQNGLIRGNRLHHNRSRARFGATGRVSTSRGSRLVARAIEEDEDLDEDVVNFLKAQDASERGFDPRANPTEIIGADEVDEEQAKAYCRDVIRILRLLEENRDMPLREAKLVLQIDDPRNDDARKMGVEDSRGVSRDEMGIALEDVAAGRIPADRIALRVLHSEMVTWPFLESDAAVKPPDSLEIKTPAAAGAHHCLTSRNACWCQLMRRYACCSVATHVDCSSSATRVAQCGNALGTSSVCCLPAQADRGHRPRCGRLTLEEMTLPS